MAHELTHAVRYTAPDSRSDLKQVIAEADGNYSYWETGRTVALRELVVNEGLAVQAARAVSPGHAIWEYYGYGRREYARIRELEPVITPALTAELDRSALGLRLRFLSGGMSDEARTTQRSVLPERCGYYIGAKMVEPAIAAHGLDWAVRASAQEILAINKESVATA